jgi:hypothetical protein
MPQTGGQAGVGSAEAAESIEVPVDVLKLLEEHPGDAPWGRRSQEVDTFVGPIEERHRTVVKAVVELARWRLGVHSDHRAVRGSRTEWSIDAESWKPIPKEQRPHGRVSMVEPLPVDSIEALGRKGVTEPIGHALLREARENVYVNPRSALVVGVAALEVGL